MEYLPTRNSTQAQKQIADQTRFPLLGFDFVQRTCRPLSRLRFNSALPLVVRIRLRKPCVRAKDFLDLFLLVWQREYFAAFTTSPALLLLLTPLSLLKINPSEEPEKEEADELESEE